jgi:peptidoglycan DL-endopeptidase CwlO
MAARTAPLVLLSRDPRPQAVPVAPAREPRPALRLVVGVFVALVAVVLGLAAPAAADPPSDGSGSTDLRSQLDEAQRAWLDAKTALDASVARQQQLNDTLATVQAQLAVEAVAVGKVARDQYMAAGFTAVRGIVASGSATDILDAMSLSDAVVTRQTSLIQALLDTQAQAKAAQDGIAREVATQNELLAEMDTRKQQAQQALWASGGGQPTAGFSAAGSAVVGDYGPDRNANGGWVSESTSVYEPATGGYITPRLANARDQAINSGFTNYVACYRSVEDGGEHPRGRACDFAVSDSCHYCGTAVDTEKDYGTNLAAFFVFNADRLGVLYVIWFRQIWLPSSGWSSYFGCCDASSMHTNHVHLSVY